MTIRTEKRNDDNLFFFLRTASSPIVLYCSMTNSKRVKNPKHDLRVWSPSVGLTRRAHLHAIIVTSGGSRPSNSVTPSGRHVIFQPSFYRFWKKKNVTLLKSDSTTTVVPTVILAEDNKISCPVVWGYHSLLLFWNRFGRNMYDATNGRRWVKRIKTNLYEKKKN